MRIKVNPYVFKPVSTMDLKPITIQARQRLRLGHGLCEQVLRAFWCVALLVPLTVVAMDPDAGFLYDRFPLTLAEGHRVEAIGPFFYSELKETQHTWAIPPLMAHTRDPDTESEEFDLLYPLLSYDRFGEEYRWHVLQLLSFSGGQNQAQTGAHRFTLFPFYFQQRSEDPDLNYTAFFPFYGRLKNRLLRDEIFFVMFPVYAETRKKDVITENWMYPFWHRRHGPGLSGWQFLPFAGHEHKEVTTRTNGWGEVELVPGHDSRFILWPLYFNTVAGIGTTNVQRLNALLPIYSVQRSPQRDATTVIWPFFTRVEDREKKYTEWQTPWPIIVFARGEGKTTSRIWPLFSRAHNAHLQSDFYLWPVYKYNRFHAESVERERTRILLFLYSDIIQKNTETGSYQRRRDFWPFYTHRRDYDGSTRLQVLSVIEPIIPNNKSLERSYSPLWSLWRSERNARTGATSQSLLWNLYRRDTTPGSRKGSLLFGLFQYETGPDGRQVRLFHMPLNRKAVGAYED